MVLFGLSSIALLSMVGQSAQADELTAARTALYAQYAERLDRLGDWCDDQGLAEQAHVARTWLPKRERDEIYLFVIDDALSAIVDSPTESSADSKVDQAPAAGAPTDWDKRFAKLRREQAGALFELARQAAQSSRASMTMQLLTETLREDPDHAEARRILGYVQHDDGWCTRFDKKRRDRGFVWHVQFGWVKQGDAHRYEAGERRAGRQWVTREEDQRRHRTIDLGWEVETSNYIVRTNHSLEEGVRLAGQLEQLRQIWRQLFAEYYLRTSELARAFDGHRQLDGRRAPMRVDYFRTRDQYNEQLRPLQPRIDITLGIYLDRSRRAYFFAGEEQDDGTLWHEATHQLFQESRPVARDVGFRNDFWIIEGIAAHMESLTPHGAVAGPRYFTLGGDNAGRLPAARYRRLDDGFYVPLADLTAMGMDEIQQHSDIAKLYSQSAGLAAFLMHYDAGRYRPALQQYLVAVYAGKAVPNTLAKLTDSSYQQLDQEYRQFLETGSPKLGEPNRR